MYWWMDARSDMITFQILAATNGWFAIALAPNSTLANGSITVCSLDCNSQLSLSNWYANKGHAKPSEGPFNFTTPVAHHFNNVEQKSSCTFTRPLKAQHPLYDHTITNEPIHVLWAFGETKDFDYHGKNRGSVVLNLIQPVVRAFHQKL